MKEILWNLFKKTGRVNYYLLGKELEKSEEDENRKNKGDSL